MEGWVVDGVRSEGVVDGINLALVWHLDIGKLQIKYFRHPLLGIGEMGMVIGEPVAGFEFVLDCEGGFRWQRDVEFDNVKWLCG